MQTKRAEPSSVVDYEKIDEDARVSLCQLSVEYEVNIEKLSFLHYIKCLFIVKDSNIECIKLFLITKSQNICLSTPSKIAVLHLFSRSALFEYLSYI